MRLLTLVLSSIISSTGFASSINPDKPDNGLISLKSSHSVTETANRFEKLVLAKKFTIFSRINHTENAKNIGEVIEPTELIIFGKPKIGSQLMQCNQMVAIDLPLKILFTKDNKGQTWITYNDPSYLNKRYNLKGCQQLLDKMSDALQKLTKKVS